MTFATTQKMQGIEHTLNYKYNRKQPLRAAMPQYRLARSAASSRVHTRLHHHMQTSHQYRSSKGSIREDAHCREDRNLQHYSANTNENIISSKTSSVSI
jgi:hypothetical protein